MTARSHKILLTYSFVGAAVRSIMSQVVSQITAALDMDPPIMPNLKLILQTAPRPCHVCGQIHEAKPVKRFCHCCLRPTSGNYVGRTKADGVKKKYETWHQNERGEDICHNCYNRQRYREGKGRKKKSPSVKEMVLADMTRQQNKELAPYITA